VAHRDRRGQDPHERGRRLMSRGVSIPNGSWPLEMRAETAAAYVDEPSVESFLRKSRRSIPNRRGRKDRCRNGTAPNLTATSRADMVCRCQGRNWPRTQRI
jgi:hypothetical protein